MEWNRIDKEPLIITSLITPFIDAAVNTYARHQKVVPVSLTEARASSKQSEATGGSAAANFVYPSSQYAIQYDSEGRMITPHQPSHHLDGDSEESPLPEEARRMLSGAEQRSNARIQVSHLSQQDILHSTQTFGVGDGMRKLVNKDFASRRNHITGLLSIAKEREKAFLEHHAKARKTKHESASKYGW